MNGDKDILTKPVEEFHKISGEILRIAVAVESYLEFFITNYFCTTQNKALLFKDNILTGPTGLRFGRKIDIFKAICEREGVPKENYKEVSDAVEYIANTRNKVAHWEAYFFIKNPQEAKITLNPPKSIIYKKDEFSPDEKELATIKIKQKITLKISDILISIQSKQ